MNKSTILVLAPHPDDGEFGCGAALNKLAAEGCHIYYVAFSPCTISVPEGFEKDILYKELRKATAELGIPGDHVITFNFEVRQLSRDRQLILEELVKLKKQLRPDLVFLPNRNDVHQDHQTICNEGIRAFKHASILGYELPWNNYTSIGNFHIRVEETHLDAKIKAIQQYASQGFRSYSDEEFIKGLARVRGIQTSSKYAEAFELIHWID